MARGTRWSLPAGAEGAGLRTAARQATVTAERSTLLGNFLRGGTENAVYDSVVQIGTTGTIDFKQVGESFVSGAVLAGALHLGASGARKALGPFGPRARVTPTRTSAPAGAPLALNPSRRNAPYAEGTVIHSRLAQPGERFRMVMSSGQSRPGGWGTFEQIPDQAFAREKLAITPEFKPDVSYVQEFEFPEGGPPIRIQEGVVGPQHFEGVEYPGGATQIEILNFEDRSRLIPVGDRVPLLDLEQR